MKEVFEYQELTEKAKEKAFTDWSQNREFYEFGDHLKVLEEFANLFDITIKGYSIDPYSYSYIKYTLDTDEQATDLTGLRLRTWLINNYYDCLYSGKYYTSLKNLNVEKRIPFYFKKTKLFNGDYLYSLRSTIFKERSCLTGYYTGYDILEPLFDFIENYDNKKYANTDIEDLFNDCIENFKSEVINDMEWSTSLEYFEENEAYEQEYFEDGEIFFE